MSTQKYVISFPKDDEGKDIKYRFILSLSKTVESVQAFCGSLMNVEGIDAMQVLGRYTLAINISLAFDADKIIDDLRPKIEEAMSDIIVARPNLKLL